MDLVTLTCQMQEVHRQMKKICNGFTEVEKSLTETFDTGLLTPPLAPPPAALPADIRASPPVTPVAKPPPSPPAPRAAAPPVAIRPPIPKLCYWLKATPIELVIPAPFCLSFGPILAAFSTFNFGASQLLRLQEDYG